MSKLRLLYSSNAPWANSGYGIQGRSLLPRLAELPQFGGRENIAVFAWYGLQGGIFNVDGFQIYPSGTDTYGNDVIGAHAQHFGANVVISLIDVWVMQETAEKVKPALWCPWFPVDHDPVPPKVLAALDGSHLPLSYSRWAQEKLREAGVENHYIPHGIEPSIYKVIEDVEAVRQFRREIAGPDCTHLTVMVAANKGYPDRKAFQVQLRAWAAFAKDIPGAKLYMHTEPGTRYGGVDLPALCQSIGIEDQVLFPVPYKNYLGFPSEWLAMLYNAADVYLGAAMSEGFGIPIVEAQACGTPVIVTDFSAMPELVRWGYKVPPRDMWWTPMNSWQAFPDVDGITEALNELHSAWHDNGRMWERSQRLRVSAQIHDEYSWDTIVAEQWAPLMARLAEEAPVVRQAEEQQSRPQLEGKLPQLPERSANGHRAPMGVGV